MTTAVAYTRDEVIALAEVDLDFFAALCLPEVCTLPFPPILKAAWQLLTEAAKRPTGQDKLALGLPRGFAKTLLLKLFACWCVFYTDRRFLIVVCNTAPLAENFISDVADILDSDNIVKTYGDWKVGMSKETVPLKKFTFRGRPVSMAGLGNNSSLRGLNIRFVRPDLMIMDDMQSREEAESRVESEKGLNWMLGTLMKANNKPRCLFAFIGNMYPFDGSILKKLRANPGWVSFITGAILEDGQSIWPEFRSVEDLLDELENDISMGKPEIFFSEVMNDDEAGNRSGIDITRIRDIPTIPGLPEPDPEAGFVIIDPSVGKKKNDKVAIGCIMFYSGKPRLRKVVVGAFNPKEQINECFKLVQEFGVMAILVESVAYQATLVFWMNEAKRRFGLNGVRILEIYPGVAQKQARIIAMLKQLTAPQPDIYIHAAYRSLVVHQIVHWNPIKSKNVDDILDLLAYAYPALQQFGMLLLRPFEVETTTEATFADTLEIGF